MFEFFSSGFMAATDGKKTTNFKILYISSISEWFHRQVSQGEITLICKQWPAKLSEEWKLSVFNATFSHLSVLLVQDTPGKTTKMLQDTNKNYYVKLYWIYIATGSILTPNCIGDRHWLYW